MSHRARCILLFAVVLVAVECRAQEHLAEAEQCKKTTRHIIAEDQSAVTDETTARLDAVWISQDCETRAGPEYLIRKYTFHENGTFHLTRYYYAEELCTVPTHTVTATGSIKIHGNSLTTPGASEARYHLDEVHIMPLNRQVAYKLSHRVNVSCGPHARWKPYNAQLIYERPPEKASSWQGPKYYSAHHHHHSHLQHRRHGSSTIKGTFGTKNIDCLAPLNIDFEELRLLRVQRKVMGFRAEDVGATDRLKVQLFLAGLPKDMASKKLHRPTSLQATPLLRSDTMQDCPTCGLIARGKDTAPPLLVERVTLPALLGGSWISPVCESQVGGVWLRRHFMIYGGDKLWTGRWDYFADPRCNIFLYAINGAGSYVQRPARRQRRSSSDEENDETQQQMLAETLLLPMRTKRQTENKTTHKGKKNVHAFAKIVGFENNKETAQPRSKEPDNFGLLRDKRGLDEIDYYKHLLQTAQPSMAESFAAMLRGNQRQEETTKKPPISIVPMGTTEVDLHVAESMMTIGNVDIASKCGVPFDENNDQYDNPRLSSWPSDCVPHTLEAPSTLGLKARIGIDWYGGYTLQFGPRDSSLWDAPLLQCGATSLKNPLLRSHLRRSVGIKFGLFSASSGNTLYGMKVLLLVSVFAAQFFRML